VGRNSAVEGGRSLDPGEVRNHTVEEGVRNPGLAGDSHAADPGQGNTTLCDRYWVSGAVCWSCAPCTTQDVEMEFGAFRSKEIDDA